MHGNFMYEKRSLGVGIGIGSCSATHRRFDNRVVWNFNLHNIVSFLVGEFDDDDD